MPHGKIADDKIRIGLVLPKVLKEDIGIIAKKEDRSLNAMICRILTFYRTDHKEEYPELAEKYAKK